MKNVHVFIAGRSKQEADEAIAKIRAELSTVRVQFLHLDLASLTSVRSFVENFQHTGLPLHILINNAWVMLVPYSETEDGLETHFQVNYLSHLYLTSLLLNKLKASGTPDRCAHIINVSSVVHWVADATDIQPSHTSISSYSPHSAYASSKLAVIMSTYILSQLLKGDNSNVTANCLHPGVVNTNLYDNIHWSVRWVMDIMRHLFFKNAIEAANSVVFLALSPLVESHTGGYYDNCKAKEVFTNMKTIAKSSLDPMPSLFDEEIKKMRGDPAVSAIPTFKSHRMTLCTARTSAQPKLPTSRQGLVMPPEFQTTDTGDQFLS